VTKFKQIVAKATSWLGTLKKGFDVRDVLVFGGLSMLGYGLYLLRPWLGFAVSGALMMGIGLFMGDKK
jgi:hypothetical protein